MSLSASLSGRVGALGAAAADLLTRAGRARPVLAVAADRDVPVVAKGIETPQQLAQLSRLGCPAGQGFLFARPMGPADAEAYLRRVVRAAPLRG
jgi:EAL domain-containing protein (putative c-di-GMP-specific phosphodiesterase class I)